jgi:hypothetical protein
MLCPTLTLGDGLGRRQPLESNIINLNLTGTIHPHTAARPGEKPAAALIGG